MIIQDYSEHIENFENYLKSKLASIDEISGDNSVLFKKILYVSFLDSLSSCVYPGRGNKERFVSMLERFSKWEDRDRVSLPHLGKFVQITSDPLLEQARKYVTPKLKTWQERSCHVISISEDPRIDEIEDKSWKTNKETGIHVSLTDFKHISLLYQLRNALVHQFQSRGDEMGNLRQLDHPYYQRVQIFDGTLEDMKPVRFELVYPTQFLKSLSEKTLENVVDYLKDGNINPFPHYYAGDYWITEFN
jgi:hypothetical protein